MIDGIGYTEDGEVWIRLRLEINGEKGTGMLSLKPEFARQMAKNLNESADKASKYITEKPNERDGSNIDKGGA